ncbi:lysine N(6)-hydroxylase/L-ornithine N(5)-oxygenase family protein [Embleya hyalina]|uniref:L-lysine N6-monooxygenase MbtG n=1 Tax=Embleya hyalina TaxID=516124 RepID=A0A401Z1Y7_9ACTN|nr:SidA/IucD/PvdA family monooxygenase [Embleya hyalina]GCE00791.1 monooxygenase [Embleya hyalina]
MTHERTVDVLAIGAGPANLSLAALAAPAATHLSLAVIEARESASWHPGLLWSNSRLQVSGVKDLVSLVDPRSRFSFLNFLREQRRLYRHLIAARDHVSRKEFDQYLTWAASLLGVEFDTRAVAVDHDGDRFRVTTNHGVVHASHLVLGVGQEPFVPPCAADLDDPRIWHSSRHTNRGLPALDKDVLLVGGGQSAAEVALDILSGRTGLPRRLTWVTGRGGLSPLDDSAFSDEWFNPRYVEYFHGLPHTRRSALLDGQHAATAGISRDLLSALYRRLYEIDYLDPPGCGHRLLSGTSLVNLAVTAEGFTCTLRDEPGTATREIHGDAVVFATGFRHRIPRFLDPIRNRLPIEGETFRVDRDYRIPWDGPDTNRIYIQNGALRSHGVADPNLSLAAWRSAVVLNSVLDKEYYHLDGEDITLSLPPSPVADFDEARFGDADFGAHTRSNASSRDPAPNAHIVERGS